MTKKLNHPNVINWMIGVSALILFVCSSLRHILFYSTAFDLGIFDQGTYLISQGQPPISSFTNYHILADHAAWIWYPLAILYKIYPSVYWLLAIQAIALAIGALPTWYLAMQAGLKQSQAIAVAVVYLLYPLVFNVNLFDFHPEVIALPAFLTAVLMARSGNLWWFCGCIFLVLGCKAILSLTVAALGVWLLVFEKRRLCGAIALISGIAWYIIANKWIIPVIGGEAATIERYASRFSYLGNSLTEITKNIILQPGIVLKNLFSLDNIGYLLLLFAPVAWGISPQGMTPLVSAIPCLAINLLSDYQLQKDLLHQYSLPILPFLLLTVINNLAADRVFLKTKRAIILWSLVTFLCLAKFTYFGGKYLQSLDTWQATHSAINLVQTSGSVLTTDEIATHLSQRKIIELINPAVPNVELDKFSYILLSIRNPGLSNNQEFVANLVNKLENHQAFNLQYQRDDVYLFVRK
ncbi:DUF2079 domain-containing protein [Anabaena sp. 4-3]|uniref:DUF2079 domain-containing protein n=1 Tax=Anabaena sp. 4-3 TaxID=1811979 RepID=UPI00082C1A90|nr:DUF2079 domain-containing protein [Anabaena sp. 4-3]